MLSRRFFFSHTKEFFDFYRSAILCCLDCKPNPAHTLCAEWERKGLVDAVVTQNIDGLHTAAGSKKVYELHGSVMRNRCLDCGRSYDVDRVRSSDGVPHCECEPLDEKTVDGAIAAIAHAKTLIVAGTSLSVYPAANLINFFGGDALVLINRDRLAAESRADLVIRGNVGEILSACEV